MMFIKDSEEANTTMLTVDAKANTDVPAGAKLTESRSGKAKVVTDIKEDVNRKRRSAGEKACSEPAKKARKNQKSPCKSVTSSTSCIAAVGEDQPHPNP